MIFQPTELHGALMLQIDPMEDDRGFFARLWCRQEFIRHGIDVDIVQVSLSHNAVAGTLRGLHFQWPPSRESKLVRCQRGSVFDVIVDLRPDSPTFTRHATFELNSQLNNALYVPPGFAHGFQTLQDNSDLVYMMSDYHRPDLTHGYRFDDSAFGIRWPLPVACIADRDREYPDFDRGNYIAKYASGTTATDPSRPADPNL